MEPVISSIPDSSETLLRSQPGQASPWWPFCFICHHHPGRNGRVGSRPEPGGSLRWQSPACQGLTGTVRTWFPQKRKLGAQEPAALITSSHLWSVGLLTSEVGHTAAGLARGGTSRTGKSSSAGLGELATRQPWGRQRPSDSHPKKGAPSRAESEGWGWRQDGHHDNMEGVLD